MCFITLMKFFVNQTIIAVLLIDLQQHSIWLGRNVIAIMVVSGTLCSGNMEKAVRFDTQAQKQVHYFLSHWIVIGMRRQQLLEDCNRLNKKNTRRKRYLKFKGISTFHSNHSVGFTFFCLD